MKVGGKSAATMLKEEFDYVFQIIMMMDPQDPMLLALEQQGCHMVLDVLELRFDAIEGLNVIDTKTAPTCQLTVSQKSKLHILKAWNQYLKITHGTFNWDDTPIITPKVYNAF